MSNKALHTNRDRVAYSVDRARWPDRNLAVGGGSPLAHDSHLSPRDDLRHRPAAGSRTRDSLFWQVTLPEKELGMQVYLYLNGRGRAGYNVVIWGNRHETPILHLGSGQLPDTADLDDLTLGSLSLRQPEPLRSCVVSYRSDEVAIQYNFRGIHDAFSYRSNPDGLPSWFAENRMEQTGYVSGSIVIGDRRIELDCIGHRDHSWGIRDWDMPQHWKWFVAYTANGVAVNGWTWIAKGEWGFAGYVARDGRTVPIATIDQHAEYDDLMRQQRLVATVTDIAGCRTEVVLEAMAVVELPSHDPMATVIREAACRATIDGDPGAGQFETHWVGSYLTHLMQASRT